MSAKLSFELDAGKVLAKLHLGGCESHPGALFYNSGIVNNQNIKPVEADSSKITFDLDGPGEYELGVVINKKGGPKLASSQQDIKDKLAKGTNDSKHSGTEKKESKNDDKSQTAGQNKNRNDKSSDNNDVPITDNPDEPGSKSKMNEGCFLNFLRETDEKHDRKNYSELKSVPDVDLTMKLDPLGGVDLTDPDNQKSIQKEIDRIKQQDAPKEAAAALEKNRDNVKKFMEAQIEIAREYIRDYMTVFCGEAEAKNIDKAPIKVTFLPDNFSDPYKIKKYDNYQIPALTDEQVRQKKIEWMKKNKDAKTFDIENMCFKIAYSVDLGK